MPADRPVCALPAPGALRYLPLEDLIAAHPDLFPGYRLKSHFEFRVLRDGDLEVGTRAGACTRLGSCAETPPPW
jgi:polyphosphate kinase